MRFARHDFINMHMTIIPDLIICWDGIQHNPLKDGVCTLANLKKLGARYLLTNWQTGRPSNILDNQKNLNVSFDVVHIH
jgi:hypothetical protein